VADGLVKKLEEMEKTAGNYRNLMEHTRRLLRAFFNLSQAHRGGHYSPVTSALTNIDRLYLLLRSIEVVIS